SSAVACGAAVALEGRDVRRALVADRAWIPATIAFLFGLVPFAVAAIRHGARVPILATPAGLFANAAGESGESGGGLLLVFVRDELGAVTTVVALAGAAVALLTPAARSAGAAVLALAVMGPVAMLFGAPCGPTRYASPVLPALGALAV